VTQASPVGNAPAGGEAGSGAGVDTVAVGAVAPGVDVGLALPPQAARISSSGMTTRVRTARILSGRGTRDARVLYGTRARWGDHIRKDTV